jgi:hypothetical protein
MDTVIFFYFACQYLLQFKTVIECRPPAVKVEILVLPWLALKWLLDVGNPRVIDIWEKQRLFDLDNAVWKNLYHLSYNPVDALQRIVGVKIDVVEIQQKGKRGERYFTLLYFTWPLSLAGLATSGAKTRCRQI